MGTSVWFALAANLALTVSTVALVFHTVSRLAADDRVARVCAWAVALEPTMLVWSLKVLSATLFTTCLAACVAAGIRALEHGRGRWTIAAALTLAASVYVRPMAYPLVPLMAVVMAWATSGSWVTRSRHAAMLLVMCAVLLAPWHLRNWLAAGYAGFSTAAERALVISVGGSINARHGGQPFLEIRRRLVDRLDAADHVRRRQTPAVMRREA